MGARDLSFFDPGAHTYTFVDTGVVVGFGYYYAVSAFDTGHDHWPPDPEAVFPETNSNRVPSLESSFYPNHTVTPFVATFSPVNTTLDQVLVLPNPFLMRSGFITPGAQDVISFMNVPSPCTIRIYTVRGDLVATIEHTLDTGIAQWDQVTDFGQFAESGFYVYHLISHASATKGAARIGKFCIVRWGYGAGTDKASLCLCAAFQHGCSGKGAVPQSAHGGLYLSGDPVTAGVALLDAGPEALFVNPALLAHLAGAHALSVSYASCLAETSHQAGSIALRLPRRMGACGVSINRLDLGEMVETLNADVDNPGGAYIVRGTYTADALAIGLSFAQQATAWFAYGLTLRYVRERISVYTSDNLLVDLGMLYPTGFRSFRLGGYVHNFGVDSRYIGDSFKMPMVFRLGAVRNSWAGPAAHTA